ncbi:rhodanese-related sulfurtransferase [Catalinimonas alkaloidigena]|uniref:rhodanese-like domain-containing protein n=1 Tax=Catalinimonas alkaloidigena TaxID=1075417 RepID=UPI0024076C73|nr:rhodanese-like domain-containing protein [Catalinimonas alkaloidigena]MDF9800066.1 rhodanese-related sulfurtransferase [Catalinimonas alkaloidigena]
MSKKNLLFSLSTGLGLIVAVLFVLATPKKQILEQQVNKAPTIKAENLKQRLQKEDEFVLLDTRSVDEYNTGHLKGARFVNFETFQLKDVEDISKDKEIIVYCLSGGRSNQVGIQLLEAGFTNVHNLEGGMRSWKEKGFPVFYD